MTFEP